MKNILVMIVAVLMVCNCVACDNGNTPVDTSTQPPVVDPNPPEISNTLYKPLKNDSLQIPAEELNFIEPEGEPLTIKLYCNSYIPLFSQQMDIEDAIVHQYTRIKYMLFYGTQAIYKQKGTDGKIHVIAYGTTDWSKFVKYAISPELIFDSSFTITAIYCLDGMNGYDGFYIYYKTNKGDFVLYKQYLEAEKTYLFPLEQFYELTQAMEEDRLPHRYEDGYIVDIEKVYNSASYLINISD